MTMTETPAADLPQLVEWLDKQEWSDFAQDLAYFYAEKGYLTEKQEAAARKMKATCDAKAATKKTAPKSGYVNGYEPKADDVHVVDGVFFRVHKSQSGDWFYVAVWNEEADKFLGPKMDDRAKGMMKHLTTATLATAEQAAAFGHANERCCFCSTPIDTPESKAVGYGPHCAAKRGLPWGEK